MPPDLVNTGVCDMKTLSSVGLAFLTLLFINAVFAEPANLETVKQELIAYHDSGKYAAELADVDQDAKAYLMKRINKNNRLSAPQKLAIVLDIDETSLSGYSEMLKLRFGGEFRQFADYIAQGNEPVIQPTLDLYNYAKANGVAVFFVTGRSDSVKLRNATVKNLKAAGFATWEGLYLKPTGYKDSSAIPYKSAARKEIETKGYTIVESIGDQRSDLEGGYAEKGFKLPNPYYYIA
jgi:predicted secreted acid phosphatase